MALDNKISNIIGTKIPQWLLKQLDFRAKINAQDNRDNNNLLYLANKTAWIRVVSSINLINQNDITYFNRLIGGNISKPDDLAKQFALFGGTSKYIDTNSYQLRSGLGQDGSYGTLGNEEIKKYGYRPMPGIVSVNIETQGRLGSVRAATINFKCWDKDQLDIIDALYFKLGFTMFVEWGNTFFYKADDPTKILSTDLYSIDPFQDNLSKEEISIRISKNVRDTEGNYDAMLGMVTNFNFTLNQEGGYDCSLRLMALGVLGDSIKINNQGILPNILKEEIKQLTNTLVQIEKDRLAKEAAAAAAAAAKNAPPEPVSITADELFNKYITYIPAQGSSSARYTGGQVSLSALDAESIKTADATFNTDRYGWVYLIRRQKGFIPLRSDLLSQVKLVLDSSRVQNILNLLKLSNGAQGVEDPRLWDFPANYLENSKDILTRPITTAINVLNAVVDIFTVSKVGTGESELDKANDTGVLNGTYPSRFNGQNYNIKIVRKLWATSDREDIVDSFSSITNGLTYTNSAYYYISTEEFAKQFKNVLNNPNNTFAIESIESVPKQSGPLSTTTTKLKIKIPFTRTVKVSTKGKEVVTQNPDLTVTKTKLPDTISDSPVTFYIDAEIFIDDSSLIKSFTVPSSVVEPKDYAQQLTDQNVNQAPQAGTQGVDQKALYTQLEQALKTQSSLELALRTIQVHALTKAINKTGNDLEIGRVVYPLDLTDPKDTAGGQPFLNQIFSNGIFSEFIQDLLPNAKNNTNWEELIAKYERSQINTLERLKLQAKYGFATNLMAGKLPVSSFSPNRFQTVLSAYVVPYQINQDIYETANINHPVYIPLSLLLMLLNHNCTIYDSKKQGETQTPLVYIDFSTEHNFCLSNTKQLSTNPWVTLIPFEGSFSDYKNIFDPNVLDGNFIKPVSGSTEKIPLFNPEKQDLLSGQIPPFKFDGTDNNIYRGKPMNILLNIDYLVQLVKNYSLNDGTNSIYLKTFLEQVISDLNKYLGNVNVFRLAYSDEGNTFHIVDDQVVPTRSGKEFNENFEEQMLTPDNTTSLPLFGRYSIAKNLEIKSEVSSKLSNMLAISANADIANKSTLSTNGDNFGFINSSYVDRYVTNRKEIDTGSKANYDMIINSSAQFNKTVYDFYSTINPSEASVGHATNYFIERISKIKNDEYPTRAASMIPVSVNFTTDGISGLSMGQAFTIPDELLPYTYNDRIVQGQKGLEQDHINKVGFVVVGLSHNLEANQWNTSIRANMIFLKKQTEFVGSVKFIEKKSDKFTVDQENVMLNSDSPDPRNTIYNATNYPSVNAAGYSNIKFGRGGGSTPEQDKINPTLLSDINSAARNAGVTVTITTAVTGHPSLTTGRPSRHNYGNAVDIAIVDGVAVVDQNKIGPKVNKFVDQLIALGYSKNIEVGNQKAVLTYGFPQHDNHIHISSLV